MVLVALLGCAQRYRTEYVGTVVGKTGQIELPRGQYDVAMRFDIPRAQVIQWKVSCPGSELTGAVGETFEAYRERRLTELRDLVRRDRQRAEAAASVVGALAPRARVVTPTGTVEVRTRVDVQPEPEVEPLVELSPGDTGRGRLDAHIRIATQSPGLCTISAESPDTIAAAYAITRVRDLVAERDEHVAAVHSGAIDARTRMRGQLVAVGADEGARARRLAEQARLEAERRAKLDAEQARLDEERRVKAEHDARIRAELETQRNSERRIQLQIEAEKRARIETERRAKLEIELRLRAEREERIRIELQAKADAAARAKWEAEAPARARAELVVKWRTVAFSHRETLIAWLVGTCGAEDGRRARLQREKEQHEFQIALRLKAERDAKLRIRLEHERQIALRLEAERAEKLRIQMERERQIRAERERMAVIERERAEREAAQLAELQRVRFQLALQIRTQITASLVGYGARVRPPRPEPRQEVPGAPPFADAQWIAGRWEFHTQAWSWTWIPGGWSDPGRFGETGHAGGTVAVQTAPPIPPPPSGGVVIVPATTTTTTIHVAPPLPIPVMVTGGTIVRDRPSRPPTRPPVVRDHRRHDDDDTPKKKPVRVRDHRR